MSMSVRLLHWSTLNSQLWYVQNRFWKHKSGISLPELTAGLLLQPRHINLCELQHGCTSHHSKQSLQRQAVDFIASRVRWRYVEQSESEKILIFVSRTEEFFQKNVYYEKERGSNMKKFKTSYRVATHASSTLLVQDKVRKNFVYAHFIYYKNMLTTCFGCQRQPSSGNCKTQ